MRGREERVGESEEKRNERERESKTERKREGRESVIDIYEKREKV